MKPIHTLGLCFSLAIAFAQDKPAAPTAKTPEAKTPEIKMVSKDRQIALLKARSESAEAMTSLMNTPQYIAYQEASKAYQEQIAAAQKECGGAINQDFSCVVKPAEPAKK